MRSISLDEYEAELNSRPLYLKLWHRVRWQTISFFDVKQHAREVRWFIQRGRRGYSDCDWYDMHSYLCSIILPMLRTMREKYMSYPGYGKASTSEKWEALLDEMIEGWEAADRIVNDAYFDMSDSVSDWMAMRQTDISIFNEKSKVFSKWFLDLWD